MWLYNENEFGIKDIGDDVAFVYLITNLLTNKKYIGKKNFYFQKTRQVKGKKKRYKEISDWLSYYGSNEELKNDVLQYGEGAFKREILRLCKTKGEASYFEAKFQFETDCILSEQYYNSWISCRVRKSHLKNLQQAT